MARKKKPEIVISHLLHLGRITDATARAAYGAFSLAHAIWQLRNRYSHLVPPGKLIRTVLREDVMGNVFAEYRLVDAAPAFLNAANTNTTAFSENRQYAA
ncbi:hypothetical protein EOE18_14720 [Novosphingobium umbonatum]|uniref:Uncharacterized protein n=1 Tax=Novosphingobium umbonatum TaxID=1908524 RepID=A0A3S2X1X1_9SPHN|nr:hypothetical protein [Novosphingobium umbonatum]RVU03573.1 hypothetical protein EOE18_14720 [Novosphingobium umbonatum]